MNEAVIEDCEAIPFQKDSSLDLSSASLSRKKSAA
jgi:hypothetical protein